jgi:hypothetical protein
MPVMSRAIPIERKYLILAFVNVDVMLPLWDVIRMLDNGVCPAQRLTSMLRLKQ